MSKCLIHRFDNVVAGVFRILLHHFAYLLFAVVSRFPFKKACSVSWSTAWNLAAERRLKIKQQNVAWNRFVLLFVAFMQLSAKPGTDFTAGWV